MGMAQRQTGGIAAAVFVTLAQACGTSTSVQPAPDPVVPVPTAADRAAYVAELETLGVGQYLDAATPFTIETSGDWQTYHYDITGGATCFNGSEYIVSVRPTTEASENVMLYLQGGGACWDYGTCYGLPFASQEASIPGSGGGFLDWKRDDNPLKSWNVVFASYCDGSVFSGDHIANHKGKPAYHWGLRNLSAAVSVMREHFPDPEKVMVAGSSAGGFGTFMGVGVARVAYPEKPMYVMNDSGPGLENHELPEIGQEVRDSWRFEQFLPDGCERCDDQLAYLVSYVLDRDPDMKIGLFSYRDDAVIGSLFLQLFGDYPILMQQVSDDIHNRHPDKFRRFFVDGMGHTVMGLSLYYSQWPHGQTFSDWMDAFVTDDMDRWRDWD